MMIKLWEISKAEAELTVGLVLTDKQSSWEKIKFFKTQVMAKTL